MAPMLQFIAVHIRHGDFLTWCTDVPYEDCFAPTSAYARRVAEVRGELAFSHPTAERAAHVIVTSDEPAAGEMWQEVKALGWLAVSTTDAEAKEGEKWGAW